MRLKKNWRKPLPVLVRINGKPKQSWRINMMPTGDGSFYLYVHDTIRNASGTTVGGDRVTVELSFDRDYRGGPVHPCLDGLARPCQQTQKQRVHGMFSSRAARKRFSATSL